MPRKTENVGSKTTGHHDGTYEGVINDPGLQSPGIGIAANNEKTPNPFRLSKTKNKEMTEFEQYMRGDSLDK